MSRKPLIIGSVSVEERLKKISAEDKTLNIKTTNKIKQPTLQQPSIPTVIEKLNQSVRVYKRVGLDFDAVLDEEIEYMVNVTLKDKTTKKEVYNEVMAIGWPLWKNRLKALKKD